MCREQGRGTLAVRLLQIGARLAAREKTSWPEADSFRAAIRAVGRKKENKWFAGRGARMFNDRCYPGSPLYAKIDHPIAAIDATGFLLTARCHTVRRNIL